MALLRFSFPDGSVRLKREPVLVGAVGSSNLEVLIEPAALDGACEVEVNTVAEGGAESWRARLAKIHNKHRLGDVRISINDAGASSKTIGLRLEQAVTAWRGRSVALPRSFQSATARERVAGLLDAGSFEEFLPPATRTTSPHLAEFNLPAAFDDGVIVGRGALAGRSVFVVAQEGGFMGGAAGEVHSAKVIGLLQRAGRERPAAVLLLLDSGGVRLHEANAALVGVSEILRAVLALRASGVPVHALVGGPSGCFGGLSIIARCCDTVIMSQTGRLGLSGPGVIETARGRREFDAADRKLVDRTMGARHRYLLGDCDMLVADAIDAFAAAAIAALSTVRPCHLDALEGEHAALAARATRFSQCREADELWRGLGVLAPAKVAKLGAAEFVRIAAANRFNGRPKAAEAGRRARAAANRKGAWRRLADRLFPGGHEIRCEGGVLTGQGRVAGRSVAVVGTAEHAPIGFEVALALAAGVLRVLREMPGRPLFILVDTQGHRLSRHDELLGLSSYLAHLAQCIDLARRRGHGTVGLVYDQGVSAGIFVTGLMADTCHALPDATIQVMGLAAMARVMRVSEARLAGLARTHPVFAPGAANFVRMGTIDSVWKGDLAAHLVAAIEAAHPDDHRSQLGFERGGRQLAYPVARRVAGLAAPPK